MCICVEKMQSRMQVVCKARKYAWYYIFVVLPLIKIQIVFPVIWVVQLSLPLIILKCKPATFFVIISNNEKNKMTNSLQAQPLNPYSKE